MKEATIVKAVRVAGQVTGIGPLAHMIAAPVESASRSAHNIAYLAKLLTKRPSSPPPIGEAPSEAYARLSRQRGYSDDVASAQLQASLATIWVRYTIAAILLLSLGIASSPRGWALLSIFPAPLACLVLSVRPAFWQWQMRHKACLSFREFLRHPSEWLPHDRSMIRSRVPRYIGVLALLLLVPGVAWADSMGVTSNIALGMLDTLIPIGQGNALSSTIGILSAALLWAACGMLTYHLLVGLVATAHDGVPNFGMHTVWSPIQIVVGFCLLVPVPSTGLDGMQLGVYEIAKQGSLVADAMWANFLTQALPSSAGANGSSAPDSDPVTAYAISRQIAELEMCQAIHRLEEIDDSETPLPAASGAVESNAVVWDYGRCGSMTMPLASPAPAEAADTTAAEMSAMQAAATAYQTTRQAALAALVSTIRGDSTLRQMEDGSVSMEYDGSGQHVIWPSSAAPLMQSIQAAVSTFDAAMATAATTYLGTRDADVYSRLRAAASAQGWMSAGSYWRTLAQVRANLMSLQSASPAFSSPRYGGWVVGTGAEPDEPVYDGSYGIWRAGPTPTDRDAIRAVQHLDDAWQLATASQALSAADLAAGADRSGSVLDRIIAPMWSPILTGLINLASPSQVDPESSQITLGHYLITAADVGMAAGAVVSAGTDNLVGKTIGLGGAWQWMSGWGRWAIDVSLGLGIWLAYVYPVLPWIAVLWGIVGWVIFVVEALVAAPLYALLYVRSDGQELVGGVQAPGFVLLLNLFLYPPLLIAGVCAAFFALPLLTNFVISNFATAYIGQQGGHITGLFGILTGTALLTWLTAILTIKTLELVHILPERIPRWIGSALGGSADGVSETSNRLYAGVSSTSSRAMSVPGKSVPKPPKQPGSGNGVGGLGEDSGGNAVAGSGLGGSGGQGGGGGSVAPRMGGRMLGGVDGE